MLAHEPAIRLGAFAVVLFAMAAWEALAPRRRLSLPRRLRWPGNIGIVAIDTALVRIPGASHSISERPSNLIAKVLNILGWFEKYRTSEAAKP